MFLLKLLGVKWNRCDLTLSTLNQPCAVVVENCQAQKIDFFNIYGNDDEKRSSDFSFLQVCGGVYFCRAVYFLLL